jgi:hypothetical protein
MAMLNNQRVIIYLPFAYLQVRYRSHSPFSSMIFDDLQCWKNGDFPVHDAKYPKGTIHGSEPYRPFLRAETILDLIFCFAYLQPIHTLGTQMNIWTRVAVRDYLCSWIGGNYG